MEALAAIALAGNILQFVETVSHLISSTRQLSGVGATDEHIELTTIAAEVTILAARVTPTDASTGAKLSDEEAAMRALGTQCSQVAQQLLAVLETLKVKNADGKLRHFDSLYKALLAEWKKPEIDSLQARLDRIGAAIMRHLVSYDSDKILKRLDDLSMQDRALHVNRGGEIAQLRKDMVEIFHGMGDKERKQELRNRTMKALFKAAASGCRYSAEQIILEQIRFEEIDCRYNSIHDSHEHTLSWLFGTSEQRSPATFDEWLISDDNLYWISGKPGSGKSTLMKFLCDHPQTIERLNTWSKGKRLINAKYYFWNSGKPLQKSQEGLLRSLIYEILRKCPDMISKTFPDIWQLYFPEENDLPSTTNFQKRITVTMDSSVQSLLDTLRDLSSIAIELNVNFCFFIDGLDEYVGQPSDMIDLIRVLSTLPNLKLCVSSRPWNEFEREFGTDGTSKLYMQDFNGKDINAYVKNTFEKDLNYQELDDKDLNGKPLVEEIVRAANGVFFWVYLVVRSFQEGLGNGDSAADLRDRLRMLPKDLNEYFKRIILSDVAEFYRGHAAEMFSVAMEGEEDIPLIAYWFIRENTAYVLGLERKPLSVQQVNKRLKDTVKRLNAACKGLLEVRHVDNASTQGDSISLPSSIFFDNKVGFLHRTVREYLMLDDTRSILAEWSSADFEPHSTICKILLAQIKLSPLQQEYSSRVLHLRELFGDHFAEIPPGKRRSAASNLHQDLARFTQPLQPRIEVQRDRQKEHQQGEYLGGEKKSKLSRFFGDMRRK